MGDVTLGEDSSIWYGAVLRGDMAPIVIGARSNLQDGTIVHVDDDVPCIIGERVGVGHRVILHGCIVEDECLIGMGSILLNKVRIGTGSIVGAGAVLTENMEVPPGLAGARRAGTGDQESGRTAGAADRRDLDPLHRAGPGAQVGEISFRFDALSGTKGRELTEFVTLSVAKGRSAHK